MTNFKEDLIQVKAFVFDVDGVFTDGGLYLFPDGQMIRKMNIKDGYAVKYAIDQGFPVCIISGGESEAVRIRFLKLGVQDIFLQAVNKYACLEQFLEKYKLDLCNILYMGDDIPDIKPMTRIPITACPADAVVDIKNISKYVSNCKGGDGCVRDVIEQVLRAQNKWITE